MIIVNTEVGESGVNQKWTDKKYEGPGNMEFCFNSIHFFFILLSCFSANYTESYKKNFYQNMNYMDNHKLSCLNILEHMACITCGFLVCEGCLKCFPKKLLCHLMLIFITESYYA